ncbi:MAG TPA: heparan-alpha-glucosaminide N-acetyltransferase domain-containing protein [Gemmatimonadaceae bacterium]|nr:heparan-alpha-glucosaminide N-acetyltransferase domain-containing protein [Gemmatimonadaceae bacterium]
MESNAATRAPSRVAAIDLARGAVMILMAIDHVRVFSGLPAGGPTPGIFFTRWITHFCAPVFLFLAGTSAFLYARKHGGASRFLLTRGIWLVLLELTVLRFAWTFNFDYAHHAMAGVIWAIGWCMILMAALVRLPVAAIAVFGLAMIFGHNLLDAYASTLTQSLGNDLVGALWRVVYVGFWAGPVTVGDTFNFIVLYSIVPWIGVMAAGWAFGVIVSWPAPRRDRLCMTIGVGAVALFALLRGFNLYGDPVPWTVATVPPPEGPGMPPLLAALNTTKYPASLSFLLMTLGPTIALLPLLERARGAMARFIAVFGRVPFFYYVLHIPLIHALALLVSRLRTGAISPWLFQNHPMGNGPPPDGYAWSLPLLYLIFAITIALLYLPCRWFAALKARRKDWWLGYL